MSSRQTLSVIGLEMNSMIDQPSLDTLLTVQQNLEPSYEPKPTI